MPAQMLAWPLLAANISPSGKPEPAPAPVSKDDEFCIQNKEVCIQNKEVFVFKTRKFVFKMMNFAGGTTASSCTGVCAQNILVIINSVVIIACTCLMLSVLYVHAGD